jgi:hypothetical protein
LPENTGHFVAQKGKSDMATQAKAFDLATLEQDETAEIQLVHPSTGDEIGATVTVYGQDSEVFRAETRRVQHKTAEYMRRNRGKSMPPEEFERLDKLKVIACTKSINGLAYKGQPLSDPSQVYEKFPFVFEQVVSGIMDRANFIKG